MRGVGWIYSKYIAWNSKVLVNIFLNVNIYHSRQVTAISEL